MNFIHEFNYENPCKGHNACELVSYPIDLAEATDTHLFVDVGCF